MTFTAPRPLPDTVFLSEAIDQVGTAMFGDAWTGREMRRPAPPPELKQVSKAPPPITPITGMGAPRIEALEAPSEVSAEDRARFERELAERREKQTAALEEWRAGFSRFFAVANLMAERLELGDLVGSYRNQHHYGPEPICPHSWGAPEWLTIFQTGEIRITQAGRTSLHKVCVEKGGLAVIVEAEFSKRKPSRPVLEQRALAELTELAEAHVYRGEPKPRREDFAERWSADIGEKCVDWAWRSVSQKYPAISRGGRPRNADRAPTSTKASQGAQPSEKPPRKLQRKPQETP